MEAVFLWLDWELLRNPSREKEAVYLCDGQETLWQAVQNELPNTNAVQILDLLHVTPRLWKAAHVFHAEKSQEAEKFVRQRVLRVLQGKAEGVIRGLARDGHQAESDRQQEKDSAGGLWLPGEEPERMRYDEYLAAGYPIASGVIEERAATWSKIAWSAPVCTGQPQEAQAMLDLRSVFVNANGRNIRAIASSWRHKPSIRTGKRPSRPSVWPPSGRLVTP